jgi:cyclophilin family peptidyl-prolyl cis-trans isomerase
MKSTFYAILLALVVSSGLYFGVSKMVSKTPETISQIEKKEEIKTTEEVNTKIQEQEKINTQITNKTTKNMTATLHTNRGDIEIEFRENGTPNTVKNFITLAESGFYDGVKFHRVKKDFMIQGGDPLTKDDSIKESWGRGGPGYKFDDEIDANNKNIIGTISMANSGPNTNGSQFFINVADNNFLDPKHTVFGKVISGMDVVTKIENEETDPSDRPINPVIIEKITVN